MRIPSRFQGLAHLLVPWGVPQTAAQLYGYLLLSDEPVSLDTIVADLGISKSTASVTARLLEMYTLVRRSRQRGTRTVLVEASDDFDGMLNAQKRSIERLARLINEGAQTASSKKNSRAPQKHGRVLPRELRRVGFCEQAVGGKKVKERPGQFRFTWYRPAKSRASWIPSFPALADYFLLQAHNEDRARIEVS